MNERIVSEIELMSREAISFLKKSFENDLNLLYLENKHLITSHNQFNQFIDLSRENIISHILLSNLGIDADKIARETLGSLRSN